MIQIYKLKYIDKEIGLLDLKSKYWADIESCEQSSRTEPDDVVVVVICARRC